MAWKDIEVSGEQITVNADPAVDLSGGRIAGLFLCRVRSVTGYYVRSSADGESVLVTAPSVERAIAKIKTAIEDGRMIRRTPYDPK